MQLIQKEINYDFLKKLVKEACLVPLFFMSACVFLFVFLAGEGCFSFMCGSVVICTSLSSLASVDSLSQTFSVTANKKNNNNKKCRVSL